MSWKSGELKVSPGYINQAIMEIILVVFNLVEHNLKVVGQSGGC